MQYANVNFTWILFKLVNHPYKFSDRKSATALKVAYEISRVRTFVCYIPKNTHMVCEFVCFSGLLKVEFTPIVQDHCTGT